MLNLQPFFDAVVTGSTAEAEKLELEAALPIAFFKAEIENKSTVEAAMAALRQVVPDIGPILSHGVLAALATLPEVIRETVDNDLVNLRMGSRRIERGINLQGFRRRLKEFVKKVDAARAQQENDKTGKLVLDRTDPMRCARAILGKVFQAEVSTLCRWANLWWEFNGKVYEQKPDELLRAVIYNVLEDSYTKSNYGPEPFKPTRKLVEDVVDALKALIQVPYKEVPCWLDAGAGSRPDPKKIISYENGILPVEQWLVDPNTPLIPHTPAFFNQNALPYDRTPGAKCPKWIAFLEDTFENDQFRIATLRVYMGYLLTPDTSLQIIMIFLGLPRSGKGTVLRIIAALLGKQNITAPKLASLAGPFGLHQLVGKTFAMCGDVNDVGRQASEVVEVLLGVSGEDPMNVDRKHKDSLTDVRLQVRVALTMNMLVNLPNASGALIDRFRVLPFLHTVKGKEDPHLTDKLLEELPGIAEWALGGLRAMRQAQTHAQESGISVGEVMFKLLQAPAGDRYLHHFRRMTSPIFTFLEEECLVDEEKTISRDDLFLEWESWCMSNSHKSGSKTTFVAKLLGLYPHIEETRVLINGHRIYMLKGIAPASIDAKEKFKKTMDENAQKEGGKV